MNSLLKLPDSKLVLAVDAQNVLVVLDWFVCMFVCFTHNCQFT